MTLSGVAQLNMVENVERLHGKLHGHALCKFCFLGQGHIDLPAIESPNHAVGFIAEANESFHWHRLAGPEKRLR